MEINKIYCESCIDTMARMPDNFIDLTVTSPPYDNLRNYNGYDFDFESIAKELFRVTKIGGVVVWVVGDATINGSETGTSFKQALYFKEIGFNLHDTMIYYSNKLVLNHNRYEQEFEYMFVFCKDKLNVFNPKMVLTNNYSKKHNWNQINKINDAKDSQRIRNERTITKKEKIKGNVWFYNTGSNSSKDSIAFQHPAIFPEQLAKDHIYSWSNKGDLVYDCFMGSGTTAKACLELERNFIGSEISQEYCKIAEKRIDLLRREKRLF